MVYLPTLPRASWLKRLSIALGIAAIALGIGVIAGWVLDLDELAEIHNRAEPLRVTAAIALCTFGGVLLMWELGFRRVAWAALLPAALGTLVLLEKTTGLPVSLDRLLLRDALPADTFAGLLGSTVASAFLASGLLLAWLAAGGSSRLRTPTLALAGSVILAIGFSSLVGYSLRLPSLYSWSVPSRAAPLSALTLLVLGTALMVLALRESLRAQPGAPPWLPLPVVVASATVTAIFTISLQSRESEYRGVNTEIELNALASSISQELSRQIADFDRLARRWGQEGGEVTPTVREIDAVTQLNESPGCRAISLLDPASRTLWIYPLRGNETQSTLVHDDEPTRSVALELARKNSSPVLSGSFSSADTGPSFAIYAPWFRGGRLAGFVAGDFTYRRFLGAMELRTDASDDYHCSIDVGGVRMYDSPNGGASNREHAIEKVFSLHDRRVRIALAPSDAFLSHNRRYLPELALASGFGITLLLGLSVHLARTARSGLRSAETSNKRLLQENEERRRVEGMLKVTDERLHLALDSTQGGIFEWTLASHRVYYSPGVWIMLGYDPARQPPTLEAWMDLVHRADLPLYKETWLRQMRGETPFIDPEYRVRAADGNWRWVYVRSRGLGSQGGGPPSRIVGTIQDVTEHKHAEQALRASQAATRKLSLVASRTDNLVLIVAPDGRIEWVNESFERVMEFTLSEISGRSPEDFMVGPETDRRTIQRIRVALGRGEGITTDLVNYSKSGRKFHMHLEIQPVRNEEGAVENFIAIETDVTARVETERALRQAKAEADDASRAKSDFLASMSHEIRTPMNGVIGMTSLLLETPLDAEQRDYLNTIRNSGEALLTIINDILDFSKIESGHMDLDLQPIELQTCIEEALDLFAVVAASKQVELAYYLHDDVPLWIEGDVTRLRQVLVNLVNNGVKFTPRGSVAIEVQRAPLDPAQPAPSGAGEFLLQFTVMDTGIGIPPERRDRLFKPFSQVDSSTTRKYGGTGLGLAICHRLVGLMGGRIAVESEHGQGSRFTFTVVTKAAVAAVDLGSDGRLPDAFRGRPVLCIEDHPMTKKRLLRLFREWDAAPISASTVSEASSALDALIRQRRPVVLVLDLPMLGQPGGEALREQIAALRAPTVLILPPGQTAANAFGERRFFATTSKPLKKHALLRALRTLVQAGAADSPPANDPSAPGDSPAAAAAATPLAQEIPLEVLVVEDNPVNQKVALRFMERLGYEVDTVANGVEAVNAAEVGDYDLIFMDLQMPEMDGFEASRQIRRRLPADRQPKIVALTANALEGDRELCLAAGMDDYITKPVKLQDIAAVIRKQFS